MSDALTVRLKVALQGAFINTLTDLSVTNAEIDQQLDQAFTDGTIADKVDKAWFSKSRALTSGNDETLDLYDWGSVNLGAGAGKDPLGQAQALVEIAAILIYVRPESAGNLIVGNDGTTAAFNSIFAGSTDSDTAAVTVKPGGIFLIAAPGDPAYAVADTSNHLLKLAASGGNVTYDIHVLGRSA